jgi:MoaA/NifB/PqqE/SkfB family radical SAM enzyme
MPIRNWSELHAQEWLRIIEAQKATSVHITGGEPLLYKELIPLLNGLHEMNVQTSILSNGSMPEVIRQNNSTFARLRAAQISLDSMNQEIHDKRRGFGGAYAYAMDTLDILKNLLVPISISMVVDAETVSGIYSMADFCRSLGAKLVLRPLARMGRSANFFEFDSSLLNGSADIIVPDQFGYGAMSIGGHVPQVTLNPSGQFATA